MSENPEDNPQIGVDSWVASHEGREARGRGPGAIIARGWSSSPDGVKLLIFLAIASSLPFWLNEGDLFNFGLFTLLYAMLGLGLNVIVGWGGLLDLGYVAYYGFGAYGYALVASGHYGIHWSAEYALPLIILGTMLVAAFLGMTSRRLLGDYYAIVTLFFLQAFAAFTNTADPVIAGNDLTGGPNGIANVDRLRFFGYSINSTKQEYFFLLIVVGLTAAAFYLINMSRTGRAWRAQREDPLAAEAMTIPVNRVKLLAVLVGAGTAGLTGAIFASIWTAAPAGYFSVNILVVVYAVIILGGLGSIAGVILGAVVINVSFEYLAPQNPHPDVKRWLFYAIIVLLIARMKPWWRGLLILGGTLAFGFAAHAIATAISPSWTSGTPTDVGSHATSTALSHWVIIPDPLVHGNFGNFCYVALVVAAIAVRSLSGWWRTIVLIPTLYLTAVVWENVLAPNPSVTAQILFGVMLIVLMTARPQGLLGQARVEIV